MSLQSLIATGTKLWLDGVDPELIRKNRALGATGATSNPIIISEIVKTGQLDGLIACGRHIACDPNSHGFMREIPQCWITGQGAGAAAAIAANRGVAPRAVDIAELQSTLLRQGVYLNNPERNPCQSEAHHLSAPIT